MRRVLPVVLLLAAGAAQLHAEGDDTIREGIISSVIQDILNQGHFRPQKVNEDLSHKAFRLYLERLDFNKQFLLQEDVGKLRSMETNIAEDFRRGHFGLLNLASELMKQRVEQVHDFVPELLERPFNFEKKDSLITDAEHLDYCATMAQLRERWREVLKYQTLLRYLSSVEAEGMDKSTFHPELEKKAREGLAESMRKSLERIMKMDREDNLARYLNAVVNVYDPHTEYFPPIDKDNFDIQISGRLEGIGAQLREDDGYIKVVEIVPGSASWRQGELQPDDVIMKVAQGDEEPVDVVGASIDDAVKMIRGKKGTEVRLTVRKSDGRIKVIPIVRDIVVLEETYAKGVIIEHKNLNKRFGYINLPKFYTDFRNPDGRRCAEDVKLLLEQFNKNNVDGVVLDLRNNGGGALDQAVDMAGLFIEEGPIVQVQDRFENRKVLADTDPEVVYGGPLVILVNGYSASASEIVSAALQDYNRAVVVGTHPTFGKGTVQQFYDLDQYLGGRFDRFKPLGSLKMTTQQFYRINGASTQLNGVTPDILLPDVFGYREQGARNLDHSLPGDTIVAARFERWSIGDVPVADLRRLSDTRVDKNTSFSLIEERVARILERQKNPRQSLNWRAVLQDQEQLEKESEAINDAAGDHPYLTLVPLEKGDLDEVSKARMEEFFRNVKKDIYIDEAVSILNDLDEQVYSGQKAERLR